MSKIQRKIIAIFKEPTLNKHLCFDLLRNVWFKNPKVIFLA